MSTKLSPYQFFGTDASGDPLSGYQVFTYAAGSTTKQTAYQDSGGVTPHANPIILDTLGFPPAPIWLTEGEAYKLVVAEPDDTDPPTGSVRTFDGVTGVNDINSSIDQWISSGLTPTYVSGVQFTVPGDQTSAFQVGRRIKSTNSGGTRYSTISSVAYTSLTTVTVVNDSGLLDAGLSAVFYGLITSANTSLPAQYVTSFTPRLIDNSFSDSLGQIYAYRHGYYVRTGNTVHFNLALRMSNLGTLSSVLYVDGLPFPAVDTNSGAVYMPVSITGNFLNITAGYSLAATIEPGSDRIVLDVWSEAQGTATLTPTLFSADGSVQISGFYFVA